MATFSDDFARADSTDLGAGWVEVSGDWAIVNGQLSPGADSGTIILRAAAEVATSDNYAQVTLSTPAAGASQGVWCRGNTNISNGYLWRTNGTTWDLFSVVSSTFTILGTYTAAPAPGDVAKVQAVGSTIKAFVNGLERVSVTNTAVPTGTYVGLRSDSVSTIRYDAFIGADVVAGVALGTATATETALTLAGAKTALLGVAGSMEQALPFTGSKTGVLGAALESESAQPLPGAKTTPLGTAGAVETAQALTGARSLSLAPATAVEEALPLTGVKTGALGTALEVSTARPLIPAGPATADNVELTVGAPYSPWAVGSPHGSGWEVGAPW